MYISAKEAATIVFIDFQHDFCNEGGALHGGSRDRVKVKDTGMDVAGCIMNRQVPVLEDAATPSWPEQGG